MSADLEVFPARRADAGQRQEPAGAGNPLHTLTRWEALTRYTTDGRLEMSNNAAERVNGR